MRIAIFNRFNSIVGGVEQYLASSIPLLSAAGHDVQLWSAKSEIGAARSRTAIDCPTHLVPWQIQDGHQPLAEWFHSWDPDVICVHSPLDAKLEQFLLSRYPAIFFGHAYALTCISGGKTLHDPLPHPCTRRLGPGCLLHYYPHRCGGLNPITMIHNYSGNIAQRRRLLEYAAVVTFSSHMRDEYERHGVGGGRVKHIRPPCPNRSSRGNREHHEAAQSEALAVDRTWPLTIGFLGRLEQQKGADILLHALPYAADKLCRRLKLVIAGEGRDRQRLHSLAEEITRKNPAVDVQFQSWITSDRLDDFFVELSLLVVPSVWPEPFGLVGLEAAAHGVPAAAFAVGGIPEWLIEGSNGHLAPASPPTSLGLSEAIVSCLIDPFHHAELRQGARKAAAAFSTREHISSLLKILCDAARLRVSP